MLMELITCGVLDFFNMYILTARSAQGEEKMEVSAGRAEQTLKEVGN